MIIQGENENKLFSNQNRKQRISLREEKQNKCTKNIYYIIYITAF